MTFDIDDALKTLEEIKNQNDDETDDGGFECYQCGATVAIRDSTGWQCKRCGFGCNGNKANRG